MGRHPELSLRKAAYLDPGKYKMGKVSVVNNYFSLMKDLYRKLGIGDSSGKRIYNLDETGFKNEPK